MIIPARYFLKILGNTTSNLHLTISHPIPTSTYLHYWQKSPIFQLKKYIHGRFNSIQEVDSIALYPGAFSQQCMLEVHRLKRGIEKYYALKAQIASHLVDLVEKYADFCQ
jgi:hypothetical protein